MAETRAFHSMADQPSDTGYNNKVVRGDCLEGLRLLSCASADMAICDPPYNIGKNFGNNFDCLELESWVSWCLQWVGECLRIMKPSATMFIFGYPERLAHISARLPINKQRWLQWHYANKNMPGVNFWQRSHESILCLWKEKPVFNRDAIREPYLRKETRKRSGKKRSAGKSRLAGAIPAPSRYLAHADGAMPRDVLHIPALAGGAAKERIIFCKTCGKLVGRKDRGSHDRHELIIHPTQKPAQLAARLIASCRPAGIFTAIAPFAGSGVECRQIRLAGGNFAAWEINPDYARIANLYAGMNEQKQF